MTTATDCSTDTGVHAVIFDLDGVLADTEPVHLEASRRVIAPGELFEEDYIRFVGGGTDNYGDWIESTYGIPKTLFYEQYTPALIELLRTGPSPMMPGADALVRAVHRRGLPIAVASMSKTVWVEATLEAIGLTDLFPLIVSVDHIQRPKPDPEIYLQAASLLGVMPESCIAIEDSVHGVASAAAAGMKVVQVRSASLPAAPQPGARAVIESFRDFDLGWLEDAPLGPVRPRP